MKGDGVKAKKPVLNTSTPIVEPSFQVEKISEQASDDPAPPFAAAEF